MWKVRLSARCPATTFEKQDAGFVLFRNGKSGFKEVFMSEKFKFTPPPPSRVMPLSGFFHGQR
jgi:hypothetical protein